ncbi:zinc transporter ZntB [Puniceibacterium sp. IMCC21224]|uniref:zinc transporter ZntB n=1 Tax=Puniceibacterium sp. IMCC21224 TaxID=1618204 RepID=UPI00064DB89C|nr:zinc transporter ZntB [Puniceibacterium sp. IMCC21224]KMK67311.1 Mg2+/Co2+ transporter [Puniceibacterium sp. IMCC21224]
MTPICAFDIRPDGSAIVVRDLAILPTVGYRWLHCDLGDPELAAWLDSHLPDRAADALQQTETRPRALTNDGGLIVILRGLNLNTGQRRDDMVSLRCWLSDHLVVTVRLRRVFAAEDLRRATESGQAPPSPAAFLAALCEALTDRIEENGVALEDQLDLLEDQLFVAYDHAGAAEMPDLRRSTIRLGRFLAPQSQALHALLDPRLPVIDTETRESLGESANRAQRALEELNAVRDRLEALSDHLEARQNARLARNSYALSVVAAIFLPMGFVTGLFGVNVAGMPGTSTPVAFGILTLATLGMGGLVWLILRLLKIF